MLLGCIADDFTGATDLANMLVRGGMRTVLSIGLPTAPLRGQADAVVIALKSRTIAADEAVAQSLQACRWLQAAGARQLFFKYCSTFDSTERGNIGPVTEALMQALGCTFTIACPAFPENGRRIYRGYLFVGDVLLNESGMEKHPLTPMTDANLVRVLQSQTQAQVGLASMDAVSAGAQALQARFNALQKAGCAMAIVDAISDADLHTIGQACADLALITGGSGVALGLPANFQRQGLLQANAQAAAMPPIAQPALVLSGSCSKATNAQVAHWCEDKPAFRLDPYALQRGEPVVEQAIAWATAHLKQGPVLVYATSTPEQVAAVQQAMGVEQAGHLIEQALAGVARALVTAGVRRLVCAGGETSGAVVQALGVQTLQVGPQIDPGVPWMVAKHGGEPLALALKSGNFGTVDFFAKALTLLDQS
jgi:uncharacterized protein YgbK (DUF1537 family)